MGNVATHHGAAAAKPTTKLRSAVVRMRWGRTRDVCPGDHSEAVNLPLVLSAPSSSLFSSSNPGQVRVNLDAMRRILTQFSSIFERVKEKKQWGVFSSGIDHDH